MIRAKHGNDRRHYLVAGHSGFGGSTTITPRILLVLVLPAAAIGAWLLLPSPFAHGIIIGLVVAVAALALGMTILIAGAKRHASAAAWDGVDVIAFIRGLATRPMM